jgi:hypothetical protein
MSRIVNDQRDLANELIRLEYEDDRANELRLIRLDYRPVQRHFEYIYQDRYSLSEDEWDYEENLENLENQENPKIRDITTITFIVDEETETKLKAEEFDCPICYTSVCKWDAVHLNCTHTFCGPCVSTHLDTLHKNHALLPSCALCRTEYKMFEISNPQISNQIECMLRK